MIIKHYRTVACLALILFMMAGCVSVADDSILGKTMELVGLKKPELPDAAKLSDPSKTHPKVTLRIHAADTLNTDDQGRSLALVVKIYKLKSEAAFLQAPSSSFNDQKSEKSSDFSQDVFEVRDIVLTPGKHHDVVETLNAEVPYLAIAALFRSPDLKRWRFVFDSRDKSNNNVTIGAHRCALSITEGQPLSARPENAKLGGVKCP